MPADASWKAFLAPTRSHSSKCRARQSRDHLTGETACSREGYLAWRWANSQTIQGDNRHGWICLPQRLYCSCCPPDLISGAATGTAGTADVEQVDDFAHPGLKATRQMRPQQSAAPPPPLSGPPPLDQGRRGCQLSRSTAPASPPRLTHRSSAHKPPRNTEPLNSIALHEVPRIPYGTLQDSPGRAGHQPGYRHGVREDIRCQR